VNWRLIRDWLSECDQPPSFSCKGHSPGSLRLPGCLGFIDVVDEEIVSAELNHEFVALSYASGERVIGRPVIKLKESIFEGNDNRISLPNNLQNTIRDAIKVTRKLGYWYLWNDALCITQDNEQDADSQINKMDAITTAQG
jgi:Heterokaryon incompatibility protein (HET)